MSNLLLQQYLQKGQPTDEQDSILPGGINDGDKKVEIPRNNEDDDTSDDRSEEGESVLTDEDLEDLARDFGKSVLENVVNKASEFGGDNSFDEQYQQVDSNEIVAEPPLAPEIPNVPIIASDSLDGVVLPDETLSDEELAQIAAESQKPVDPELSEVAPPAPKVRGGRIGAGVQPDSAAQHTEMKENKRAFIALISICFLFEVRANDPDIQLFRSQKANEPAFSQLDSFVDEISLLVRLTNGIAIQAELARNSEQKYVPIVSELLRITQNDYWKLVNVTSEKIVKNLTDLMASIGNSKVKTNFEEMQSNLRVIDLLRNSVQVENGTEKDVFKIFRKDMVDLMKITWNDLEPFSALEHIPMCVYPNATTDFFKCLDVFLAFKKSKDDMVNRLKELDSNLDLAGEFVYDFQLLVDGFFVANLLYEIESHPNLKALPDLLSSAKSDLEKYVGILNATSIDLSDKLEGLRTILPIAKQNPTELTQGFPNGVVDLSGLFESFELNSMKSMVANGKSIEKLVDGLRPLREFTGEVLKIWKKLNDEKYEKTVNVSMLKIEELLRRINEWKTSEVTEVQESTVERIGQCLQGLPKPESLSEIASLLKNMHLRMENLGQVYHSLNRYISTFELIANRKEDVIDDIGALYDRLAFVEEARTARDIRQDFKILFDKNPIKRDLHIKRLLNFTLESVPLLKRSLPNRTEMHYMTLLSKIDGEKIYKKGLELLNPSRCIINATLNLTNIETILKGATSVSELGALRGTELSRTLEYIQNLEDVRQLLVNVEETVKSIGKRRRRAAENSSDVFEVNRYGEKIKDVTPSFHEAWNVLSEMVKVQKKKDDFEIALEFEVSTNSAFGVRWAQSKGSIRKMLEQVDEMEVFVARRSRKNLERVARIFVHAEDVPGVDIIGWRDLPGLFERLTNTAKTRRAIEAFQSLKELDMYFARYAGSLETASLGATALKGFFHELLHGEQKMTNRTLIKKKKKKNKIRSEKLTSAAFPLLWIVILIVAGLLFIVSLIVLIYSLTPNGRKKWKRLYLRYWASEATIELYWRYSYWLDLESNKNSLCAAIHEINYEHVKALVKKGAYINVYNPFGNTPLHAATKYGHAKIVKLLLKNGADRNAYNVENKTAEQLLADHVQTMSRVTSESTSTGDTQMRSHEEIAKMFKKYRNKKFKQILPELLPTMVFRIRLDTNLRDESVDRFSAKYKGNVTDEKKGVTHLILRTGNDGIFKSDDFFQIMCVFLPMILMKEEWITACLKKESNFRDDYKFRVKKVKYRGVEYETVLSWAQWVHKQMIPYLYGVQIHVTVKELPDEALLKQVVEMHGAVWHEEMPDKEEFNQGSHPFHHYNFGPIFVIHDGAANLDHLKNDALFTLMTFEQLVSFMLKMEVHYDPERKPPIPLLNTGNNVNQNNTTTTTGTITECTAD
ncbi:unnamed protein product [Caenorhabditis sp. 36 PRJEB53466]|nr:unnamed protein product [Caenorhabditis sp. 36 PRJEB53466]